MANATADATAKSTAPATGSKPLQSFRDRGVSVTIFSNAVKRDDGSVATFHNTVMESRYRDKDGHWQSSSSFSKDQLYTLRFLIDETLRAINAAEKRQKSDEE